MYVNIFSDATTKHEVKTRGLSKPFVPIELRNVNTECLLTAENERWTEVVIGGFVFVNDFTIYEAKGEWVAICSEQLDVTHWEPCECIETSRTRTQCGAEYGLNRRGNRCMRLPFVIQQTGWHNDDQGPTSSNWFRPDQTSLHHESFKEF